MLSLLVCSCTTLNQVSIDYLKPAKVNFPEQIKKVGIVNNTISIKDDSSIEKKTNLDGTSSIYANFQGDAKATCDQLSKSIAAANYFDEVIICDSALRENDHFTRVQELSKDEVNKLSKDLGVDMLIAIEDITIKTIERHEQQPVVYRITMDVTVEPTARIYIPSRSKPLVSITPKDSIFWEGLGGTEVQAKKTLIQRDKLIDEASRFAGELPVKFILPVWSKAPRYFYNGGSFELKEAGIYVKEEAWDKAYQLWEQAYNNSKKKVQFYSAFNIALYYELTDNIDKAIEWAEKAKKLIANYPTDSQNSTIVELYLSTLMERKSEIQVLNIQMNRFKDNF